LATDVSLVKRKFKVISQKLQNKLSEENLIADSDSPWIQNQTKLCKLPKSSPIGLLAHGAEGIDLTAIHQPPNEVHAQIGTSPSHDQKQQIGNDAYFSYSIWKVEEPSSHSAS
jgi:hypothetical protein